MTTPADSSLHQEVKALVRQHGEEAESFRCLSHGLSYWFSPDRSSVAAYLHAGFSRVVAGSLVGPREGLADALEAFAVDAHRDGRRAILFAVEPRTLEAFQEKVVRPDRRYVSIKIGEQPIFDPRAWTLEPPHRSNVRLQVRRAARHGVRVREALPSEFDPGTPLRASAEAVIAEWMEHRSMSPMGFLVDLHPFHHAQDRRYFIAEKEGELVAFLSLVPIFARDGWFGEDLVRRQQAPNGTAEALIHEALTRLGQDGCAYLTLGLAPLSGVLQRGRSNRTGWIPPWLVPLFGFAYLQANPLYSFQGIRRFREKFRPDRWEPLYMAVSPPIFTFPVLFDLLTAFVPGSRLRFVGDTLLRLARSGARRIPRTWLQGIAWAFSLLLIPWIGLLLSVDPAARFGAPWLAVAWATLDLALAVAFAILAVALRTYPRMAWSLSRVLLGAVLTDVWLTMAQIVLFNLPNATVWVDVLVSVVAVLAPMSAVLFLMVVALALQPRSPWLESIPVTQSGRSDEP